MCSHEVGNTVFARIVRGEVEEELLYEDDKCIVINDRDPQAPIHMLVIPRNPVAGISACKPEHANLVGHLMLVGAKMAADQGLERNGYRLVMNDGIHGGQTVFHMHVHVIGGRIMMWPPG